VGALINLRQYNVDGIMMIVEVAGFLFVGIPQDCASPSLDNWTNKRNPAVCF